jgi:hypothetical protein
VPSILSATGASVASGLWRDERINDDRLRFDLERGLAFVADASGPMYGGYHAPFAIDPGLAELARAFAEARGSTRQRLLAAVHAAHAVMRALGDRYEAVRAGRVGLEPALEAAAAVRPDAWRSYDSHAHFMGSVTACAVGPDAAVLAQVGECRGYRASDAEPVLLAADHTLPSVLEASGASSEEVERARREHWSVVVTLLGGEKLELNVVEIATPATVALVTNGVWRCDSELAALLRMRVREDVERLVARCARESQDDATAVVLEIG